MKPMKRYMGIVAFVVLMVSGTTEARADLPGYCYQAYLQCKSQCYDAFGLDPLFLACEAGCWIGLQTCGP